jgi:hypothetical protein
MGKHAVQLVACALAAIGLIIVSTLVVDWLHVHVGGDGVALDLRTAHSCNEAGMCGSVPLGVFRGAYATTAPITFYSSLGFAALVAFQAFRRAIGGVASESASRFGYLYALYGMAIAFATGYLFAPEGGSAGQVSVSVDRTWAPAMLLGGFLLGMVALHLAIAESDEAVSARLPVIAHGRDKPPTAPPPVSTAFDTPKREIPDSIPLDGPMPAANAAIILTPIPIPGGEVRIKRPTEQPAVESGRTKRPTEQPAVVAGRTKRPTVQPVPEALRNKLQYATATVDISSTGVDAFRDDGASRIVMWRDVVGVVARRLPAVAPYDGSTFVDLVSTAGSTLRILPWTRITGEALPEEPEERARAFVRLVMSRCPELHVDGATRKFIDGRSPAAQLPDPMTLGAHDARLA